MNNKGFTLVELLVMLVVLGILIGVTIPNITGIVTNQKINTTRDNAIRMVDIAKTKVATTKEIKKPQNGECMVFSLDYLDVSNELKEGPNGGTYSKYDSFVIYKKDGKKYDYYVRLVEKLDDGDFGVNLVNVDDLTAKNENYVDVIKDQTTFSESSTISDISSDTLIQSICPVGSIKRYDIEEQETHLASPTSFATDSWYVISNSLKNGDTSAYSIGDTKDVPIEGIGTFKVRLSNITPCVAANKSKTACGVVLEFTDIIMKKSIKDDTSSNNGSWANSSLRSYLNGEFLKLLPKELNDVIIYTTVQSGHGYDDNNRKNFTTTDKMYLLSSREVINNGSPYDTVTETRQLDYYEQNNTSMANPTPAIKKYNSSPSWWWLRSANSSDVYFFNKISSSGYIETRIAGAPWDDGGVSPAFRIA